ncbi:MAG: adenosine deaminase [Chitinophagales bacterium]|nr:adenosine deaminase [Chitinophagales bacterium]
MRYLILALLCTAGSIAHAQNVTGKTAGYLESIRDNEAALTAFFSAMPKGGDLHNHFVGSIYTETYINKVVSEDYYINRNTLEVSAAPQGGSDWIRCAELQQQGKLSDYKNALMRKWSVEGYNGVSKPSYEQFFETFGGFAPVAAQCTDEGLLELKQRAKRENLNYIETMFLMIPCGVDMSDVQAYNNQLLNVQKKGDVAWTEKLLKQLDRIFTAKNITACATAFNIDSVTKRHNRLKMDDDDFTLRYQNYVLRIFDPVTVFRDLLAAFESADNSPLIVGVNIVAPEHNEVSMRDYWLHMMMYRYCHEKYPNVRYAMHAGELRLGLVQPEELTWHINNAVRIAGADRIGHGVDIAYEQNSYDLLKEMSRQKIAIEISLYSNEFILGVKGSAHPISLYRQYGVPIVICTDDAGVLRSNLVHQFVLLAERYPDISYAEIKQYVYNSIEYSFIEEPEVKKRLTKDLDNKFQQFEQTVAEQAEAGR